MERGDSAVPDGAGGARERPFRIRLNPPLLAYLRGRYYWHQSFTASAFRAAIRHFRQALELDAGYARAWSGLANCFSAMAVQAMLPPNEGLSQAKHAAEHALALEPSLAEAHVSMAAVRLFFEWNWASTERELQSAVDLSPSYSPAHALLTHYAAARGWTHYAIASARRALDLDPMSPVAHMDQAWAYLLARDYTMALNQCESMQAMGMNSPISTRLRRPDLSVQRKARDSGHGDGNGVALRYLEEALQERSPRAIWLNVEPAFDRLRADRRFRSIIHRVGLE